MVQDQVVVGDGCVVVGDGGGTGRGGALASGLGLDLNKQSINVI